MIVHVTVMFHPAGPHFIKRCIIYEACWVQDAAKVQTHVLNSQFKQAHENWNYLKVTGINAM